MGPAGPAGPTVTASFAIGGFVAAPSEGFFKVLEKSLTGGNYVVVATAGGVGVNSGVFRNERFSIVNNCQLRNQTDDVIGVGRASGEVEEDFATVDTFDMAITGGVAIPDGATGTVSLWCNAEFGHLVKVDQSQMLILKIGSFTP